MMKVEREKRRCGDEEEASEDDDHSNNTSGRRWREGTVDGYVWKKQS
jgi:hypothetical protein